MGLIRAYRNFMALQFLDTRTLEGVKDAIATEVGEYTTYNSAVIEIKRKITGRSPYGCGLFNRCIDLRSVFASGGGVEIETDKDDTVDDFSKEWLREFLEYNELIPGIIGTKDLAKELESEGKLLIKLHFDTNHKWSASKGEEKEGMVAALVMPWSTYKYKIEANSENYKRYQKVSYKERKELKEEEFGYIKIGGKKDEPNVPYMPLWGALKYTEYIDKALADVRGSNNLFATPIPINEFTDINAFRTYYDKRKEMEANFKQKKMFHTLGSFKYAVPEMSGSEALFKEIEVNAKLLSAISSIPVFFLGIPELIKNLSTSNDSGREMTNEGTRETRESLLKIINEIIIKAAKLYEKNTKLPVNMKGQGITINLVNDAQWMRLQDVYIPMRENGDLSRRTLHENTPGIDADSEAERIREEAEQEAAYAVQTSNDRADEIESKLDEMEV